MRGPRRQAAATFAQPPHFRTAHWQLTDSNPSQIQSHSSAEAKAQPACSNLAQVATVLNRRSELPHTPTARGPTPPHAQTRQPRLPRASEWQLGARRHGVHRDTGPLASRATGRPHWQREWRPELLRLGPKPGPAVSALRRARTRGSMIRRLRIGRYPHVHRALALQVEFQERGLVAG